MQFKKNNKPVRSSVINPQVLLVQSWWEDRLLAGVAQYASAHDWILNCEMRWTHRLPSREEWNGQGIIAYVGVTRPLRPLIDFLKGKPMPMVITQASAEGLDAPQVIVPHTAIGRAVAAHFLGLNFQHFGFVEFGDNVMERQRRFGFQKTVAAAGLATEVISIKDLPRRLAGLPRPMGLMAINDLNALAVMRVCLNQRFRVPEDFAIVGADNTEILCDFAPVPLSSVDCNFEKQGYAAAALLDRLMRGGRPPEKPIVILPAGVVVRRSSDTVAVPDRDASRALHFLRHHYQEPIHVGHVAREITGSLRRTQAMFRKHVGRTMAQELMRLRVEHAKTLLRDPRLKVENIAIRSGFANRFSFSRAFHRVTSQKPRSYRAALKLANATTVPVSDF